MALTEWILPALVLVPLGGAVVVGVVPTGHRVTRILGVIASMLTLALAVAAVAVYAARAGGGTAYRSGPGGVIQLLYQREWLAGWGVWVRLGMDGLSGALVVMTALLFALACLASWKVRTQARGYWALVLAMEAGLLGTFLSLDLLLFFILFEVSLVPMYLLIGLWGGPGRQKAAIKFFIYTLVGSAGLLAGLVLIYQRAGGFDLVALAGPAGAALRPVTSGGAAGVWSLVVFGLLAVAFMVKTPVVPVHTWLPDAHTEAPTAVSMLLAGVVLKTGTYGLIRVALALFPGAAMSLGVWLVGVGAVSVVWASLCAWGQRDLKRVVAYSSVHHMGYVIMGLATWTAWGWGGAVFLMLAHGLTSAAMFFIAGVVQDRMGHRELSRLGGLATTMPGLFGWGTVAAFANMGLPGLCNFVGELMVLVGLTKVALRPDVATPWVWWTAAGLACVGTVLGAAYTLRLMGMVFFGKPSPEGQAVSDLSVRERLVLVPLVAGCIILGVVPSGSVMWLTGPTVTAILELGGAGVGGAGVGGGVGGRP